MSLAHTLGTFLWGFCHILESVLWWILIFFSQFLSRAFQVFFFTSHVALAERDWWNLSFHHHDNLCYRVMHAACDGRPGHYLSGSTGDPAVTSWPEALGLPVPCYRLEISHSLTGRRGMDNCDTGRGFFFFHSSGARASLSPFLNACAVRPRQCLHQKVQECIKSTETLSFVVLESLRL